jgi:preprotein translocase subunit SecG
MQHVVLIIHLVLASALVILVLLQRSEGAGLAGPSSSGMMPVRGSGNILTRATSIIAGGFMLTSIVLAILAGHQGPRQSLAESIASEQQQTQEAPAPAPVAPPAEESPAPPVSQ